MPFKPGREKTGGRVKGTKNKKTLILERVFQRCDARNVHPADELMDLVDKCNNDQKIQIWSMLLDRLEGKQKEGKALPQPQTGDPIQDFQAAVKELNEHGRYIEPPATPS